MKDPSKTGSFVIFCQSVVSTTMGDVKAVQWTTAADRGTEAVGRAQTGPLFVGVKAWRYCIVGS